MRKTLTVAAASINTTPLAVSENTGLILEAYREAVNRGADLVVTPELGITGYGLEDMFYVSSVMEKIPISCGRFSVSDPRRPALQRRGPPDS